MYFSILKNSKNRLYALFIYYNDRFVSYFIILTKQPVETLKIVFSFQLIEVVFKPSYSLLRIVLTHC